MPLFQGTTNRSTTAKYTASTFRIVGLASTPHNLLTIANASGSAVKVGVRRLTVQSVSSAAAATLTQFRTYRTAVTPSGGTAPTKFLVDTGMGATNASVTILGAASADGTASAITHAAPTSTPAWQQSMDAMITSGVFNADDSALIPLICQDEPFVLRAGETLLVMAVTASVVTRHYVLNALIEEYV